MYAACAWLGEVLLLVLPGSWQLLIMEQRTKSVYMMENILCDMVRKVKLEKCVEVMWNHSILCLCWYGGKQCFVLILLLLLTFLFSEFFLFMNIMIYKSFRVVGSNLPGPGGGLESGSDTDQHGEWLWLHPLPQQPGCPRLWPRPPATLQLSIKQSAGRCVCCQAGWSSSHLTNHSRLTGYPRN